MKIAYLCSDIDVPVCGPEGCSVHIQSMAHAFSSLGHDVSITCANSGGGRTLGRVPVREIVPQGLDGLAWELIEQEILLQDHHLERDLRSVFFNPLFARQASLLFKDGKPDLLYERYALFGWAGAELSHEFGVPLVLEVNAPLCLEQDGYEKFTLQATARGMDRHLFDAATLIVAVSQWLKNWIVSLGVDDGKVHVIPNGVGPEMLDSGGSGDEIREQHGLRGRQVVGHVGSFQEWHDVGGLLRAFVRVHSGHRDRRLLLVGDGPCRAAAESLARQLGIAESVVFAGHVPHERMSQHLAAMDVAVVPYGRRPDFYFSPMKLFEAMALGRPTVAASLGQIAEVIDHERTGWLYEPGDVASLARGLETLLENPRLAAEIGAAGRQKILRDHTWEAVARQVLSRLEALTSHRDLTTAGAAS
jgi:glycosyltransferase involved in cell wall biosynthesis